MSGTGKFRYATWMHTLEPYSGPGELEDVISKIADSGFDIFIPCIKQCDGYADYQSKIADVRPSLKDKDLLADTCEICQKKGLEVHPWICTYAEGRNSALARKYPYIRAVPMPHWPVNKLGHACTARQEVKDYVFDICQELLDNYPVKGIHFDYVRTGGRFCYCEICRAKVLEILGQEITECHYGKPANFEDWIAWKCSNVTEVIRKVYKYAHNKDKEVSAAVLSGYFDAVCENGQDWYSWLEEGIVDLVMPMSYQSSNRVFRDLCRMHASLVDEPQKILEGIYINWGVPDEKIEGQIRLAKEENVGGVCIFDIHATQPATWDLFARMKKEMNA